MRIVNIEDFFHPDAGYQVNMLSKYMVQEGNEVFVITSELDKIPDYLVGFFGKEKIKEKDQQFYERTGVKIIRIPLRCFFSGRAVYHREIFRIVDSLKPDVLYVHGNDTLIGIQYVWRMNRLKYPILLDSHMSEKASMNKFSNLFRLIYRWFVTPKIIKENITVIRTQNIDYVEKHLGIPLEQCPWISIGTDTMHFKPDEEKRRTLRDEHKIGLDDFVVIYAGKLDEAKGGLLLAEACEELITCRDGRRVTFVIIGNAPGEYGKEVEEVFSRSKNKIFRFPTQTHYDLAGFYQMSDIAVFPRQCSLSFFDVQGCGLPTVLEEDIINNERVNHHNGLIFEPGSASGLREKIRQFADMGQDEFRSYSANALNYIKENYDYAAVTKKYLQIIYRIIENYNKNKIG